MAELILTEEEKEAATYLEWNDEAIGKAVKRLAKEMQDNYGEVSINMEACALFLSCQMYEADKNKYELELLGVTNEEEEYGDFKITIERIKCIFQ